MKVNYNNIGIGVIAISSILDLNEKLSLAKITLIIPFITHNECLNYLAKPSTKILSVEKFIVEKTSYFSNFNDRYYDSLILIFSSIQYLAEMGYIGFKNGLVYRIKKLEYNTNMGKRAEKIYRSADNISKILSEKEEKLFLNLRIKL